LVCWATVQGQPCVMKGNDMTTTQSIIPFHSLVFSHDLPKLRDVEKRLRTFLKTTRE
jgi:hypothetical protein